MNKILITAMVCLAFLASTVMANGYDGVKSYPLYKSGATLVNNLDDKGKEIVRIEYDLIFSEKQSFRQLSPNWTYSILAFADNGVEDLDIKLYVYDTLLSKWVFVKKDTDTDSYAALEITPTETADYKVVITVYKFKGDYTAARYGLIYYHD